MILHIDTDIGHEMTDAAALVLAATQGEINLVGVSTVTGDTKFRMEIAKKLLELLKVHNVPVVPDAGAAQLIIDLANKYARELVLVGIGPLTNIAAALDLDQSLPQKIKHLVLMGGIIDQPIVDGIPIPRGFEYNFCTDSGAAEKVLNAGFNLTILPGDVTFQKNDPWTEAELSEIHKLEHPAIKLLAKLNDESLKNMHDGLEKAGFPAQFARPWVNDEMLMTYLIRQELFQIEVKKYRIEMPDKYPRFIEDPEGFEVTLIVDTDYNKVRRFILDHFATFPPTALDPTTLPD